ncbi:MAG TPA: hypothetical protein VGP16_04195 [Asanoa sp.]|jgi:hypothetical protein|nr:hypothetical protein [Asanoa sp.]
MKSLRNQVLSLAMLVFAVAALAACGGGGSSSSAGNSATTNGSDGSMASTSSPSSTGSTTTSSSSDGESVETAVQAEDPVSEGAAAVSIEPRDIPTGEDNDEVQPTGAKPVEPCRLVTRQEASAILGKGTKSVERPQGPTCIYTNAGRTVTLAVETNSVKQLRKEARKSTKVDLGGKTGYCVKYQTTAVITGISEGRVLRADGPCQAGVRFVTKALRRL